MNRSNFNQTGGYPLKTERLQELENAYSIFNTFGALAGNLSIISGCATIGATVQDGFVYIDGELLEFKSGAVTPTSTVIIIETPVDRAFENGSVKTIHTIRYATFGTAETSWLWTDFKRPIETKTIPLNLVSRLEALEKKNAVFQAGGGMVLWNKPAAQIPAGWQEVVDWRGRMPVGFDSTQTEFNTIGKPGGQKNKTLTIAELPRFRLKLANQVPSKQNDVDRGGGSSLFSLDNAVDAYTEYIGGDQSFSMLNPYRVVLFIEYIG